MYRMQIKRKKLYKVLNYDMDLKCPYLNTDCLKPFIY